MMCLANGSFYAEAAHGSSGCTDLPRGSARAHCEGVCRASDGAGGASCRSRSGEVKSDAMGTSSTGGIGYRLECPLVDLGVVSADHGVVSRMALPGSLG